MESVDYFANTSPRRRETSGGAVVSRLLPTTGIAVWLLMKQFVAFKDEMWISEHAECICAREGGEVEVNVEINIDANLSARKPQRPGPKKDRSATYASSIFTTPLGTTTNHAGRG
jgi:hypothetical protein